ncbi:lytic transglycosylase domain-containing protein [Kitasatospora sp. KL5]|uniref:lytic transglycosylase domain-containing protein n=1 Tax=Kitasatospora sp. KL5 TaxID=3425125 RepID=UPI003D6E9228
MYGGIRARILLRLCALAVAVGAASAPGAPADRTPAPTAAAPAQAPADGGGPGFLPLADPPTAPSNPPQPLSAVQQPVPVHGTVLPAAVLDAYRRAEATLAAEDPGCHLPWQLLAAIGQVESGQARGGRLDAAGTTPVPILGPALDGNGFAAIPDTDHGIHDGDTRWDRAVGPLQFIPSTWTHWGADGNNDGRRDPNNIHDSALAAGRYLCAGPRDLADPAQLDRAILGYNHSADYLRTVKAWMQHYRTGTTPVTAPAATIGPNRPVTTAVPAAATPRPTATPRPLPSSTGPSPTASTTPVPSPTPTPPPVATAPPGCTAAPGSTPTTPAPAADPTPPTAVDCLTPSPSAPVPGASATASPTDPTDPPPPQGAD